MPAIGAARRHRSGVILRRALARFGEALARELAGADAPRESWLSQLDARAKALGFLLLIFGATLLHDPVVLGAALGLAVLVAVTVGPGARRMARAWLSVPVFTLAIILPATLNLVTPGTPVVVLWRPGPEAHLGPWALPDTIAVTRPGLSVAARFLLRTTTCVTLALVLVATSDPSALLGGLRRLGMPRAFGMVLAMMQRYLALLLRAAEEMHLARLSRTVGPTSLRAEQSWVAAGMGNLFRRTRVLAEQVHLAMLARGFEGEVRIAPGPGLRGRDIGFALGAAVVTAGLLAAERLA